MVKTANLEIVWRNQKPPQRRQRWSKSIRILERLIMRECDSSYTCSFTRRANGTTDIEVLIAREGKPPRMGTRLCADDNRQAHLERAFQNAVKTIEARNGLAQERAACEIEVCVTSNAERSSS